MKTKSFLRTLGVICLIPAFISSFALGIIVFIPQAIPVTFVMQIFIGIGYFCFAFYVLMWALIVFADNTLWMKRDELEKATQKQYRMQQVYEKAFAEMKNKVLVQAANDILKQ